jgi:hypothetical protein
VAHRPPAADGRTRRESFVGGNNHAAAERLPFQKAHLEPLIAAAWLKMTIPNKPRSRLQRYRTTTAGVAVLQKGGSEDDSADVQGLSGTC